MNKIVIMCNLLDISNYYICKSAFCFCLQNRLGLFDDVNTGVYMHLFKINRCKYTYGYDCLTLSLWE